MGLNVNNYSVSWCYKHSVFQAVLSQEEFVDILLPKLQTGIKQLKKQPTNMGLKRQITISRSSQHRNVLLIKYIYISGSIISKSVPVFHLNIM